MRAVGFRSGGGASDLEVEVLGGRDGDSRCETVAERSSELCLGGPVRLSRFRRVGDRPGAVQAPHRLEDRFRSFERKKTER
jgi:hypothetical protein